MAPTMPGTPTTVSKKINRCNRPSGVSDVLGLYPVILSNDHLENCTNPYAM